MEHVNKLLEPEPVRVSRSGSLSGGVGISVKPRGSQRSKDAPAPVEMKGRSSRKDRDKDKDKMEMKPRQKPPKREKLGGDLNKKHERMKLVSSLKLKNFNSDEASILISGFLVMDADNDGFVSTEEAFIYMRAMGWVWPDEHLIEVFVRAASGGVVKYNEAGLEMKDDNTFAHLNDLKKRWTMVELIRIADANASERFSFARDAKEVKDVVLQLDHLNQGSLMRADIHKFCGRHTTVLTEGATIHQANRMLEALGFANNKLSFHVNELGDRFAEVLAEPRNNDFQKQLETTFV